MRASRGGDCHDHGRAASAGDAVAEEGAGSGNELRSTLLLDVFAVHYTLDFRFTTERVKLSKSPCVKCSSRPGVALTS